MINSTSVVASSNNNNANPSQTTAPMPPQPQPQANQPGVAAQTANPNAQAGQNSAAAALAIQQKLLDRDIVNLVYHLIKDNPDGCERFSHQLVDKVETFLSPFVVSALYHTTSESSSSSPSTTTGSVFDVTQASLSSIRFEMILLGALMQKQFDDSSWEQLLRVVVHVLLRSLSVANLLDSSHRSSRSQHKQQQQQHPSQNYNNPVIIECLTLPCLRIINNMCKLTSNVSYLTNLISAVRSQKSTSSNFSTTSSAAVGGPTRSSANNMGVNNSMGPIGRYFSEPGDPNPQVF